MNKLKRTVCAALILVLMLSLLPLAAYAKAGNRLSGDEKLAYDALSYLLDEVAAGKRSATSFTIGQEYYDKPVHREVTFKKSADDFDYAAVADALWVDHPYAMYWYGYGYSVSRQPDHRGTLVQVTFYFNVGANYQGNAEYTIDSKEAAIAARARKNALAVVNANAHKSDYQKLVAYRDYICNAVTYDEYAANNDISYRDMSPWQLVNVFDGDSTTNVVCEGYSKAFKYLCDLSDFEDKTFTCHLVTGWTLSGTGGGGHMWNQVTLGGKNYLVDVTNSDDGSVGQHGGLFLAGSGDSVSTLIGGVVRKGYQFECKYSSVQYYFDDESVAIWGWDLLKLTSKSYEPGNSCQINGHSYNRVVTAPTFSVGGYTTNTCTACGYSYISNQTDPMAMLKTPAISKLENKAGGSIQITWNKVAGAERYRVFMKVDGGWKSVGTVAGTSMTWSGAQSGKNYTFTVRCVTAKGEAASDYNRTGKSITYVACPSIAKVENTATGVKISWNAVPGAAKYKLVVKEEGGSWKTIRYTTNNSYTWTGAVSGKTYTFGICCVTSDGKTATSAFDSTGKTIKYVAQPTINKVANMANGVAIAWNKVPGAAKYKIVVKTATSGWKTVAYSTGSTYTWTGGTSGETYTFGIVCVTADGKTVTSAFNSTGKTIKYIACPKIAKLEKTSTGIKVTWDKVVGAAKYKLIVKEEGGSWKTIWNTINSSYTWTGAVKGKTYIFSLRCITADGKSYTSGWNSTGWTIKYN